MLEAEKLRRLEKACALGRTDFAIVLDKLTKGEYQFFEKGDACALTHIGVSGAFRTLYVDAIAGDILDVPELGTILEGFGKAMGCQAIEADGRLGWDRLFRSTGMALGWRKVAVKYRKDI